MPMAPKEEAKQEPKDYRAIAKKQKIEELERQVIDDEKQLMVADYLEQIVVPEQEEELDGMKKDLAEVESKRQSLELSHKKEDRETKKQLREDAQKLSIEITKLEGVIEDSKKKIPLGREAAAKRRRQLEFFKKNF